MSEEIELPFKFEELEEEVEEELTIENSIGEKDFKDPFLKKAEEVYNSIPFFYEKQQKQLYIWNGRYYERITEEEFIHRIYFLLGTIEKEGKIIDLQKTITQQGIYQRFLKAVKIVGTFKFKQIQEAPYYHICFKDKVINVKTLEELKPTPAFFYKNVIPWQIGTLVETDETTFPTIAKLLRDWIPDDEQRELILDGIAHILLPKYLVQKIFFLLGNGRNGKSKFLKLLTKLVGFENVVATSISRLENSRFEFARLYGKLLCVMSEFESRVWKNTEMIKNLTGEDPITSEFKGGGSFDFVSYAKLFIATNNLPITEDTSDAFYSRPIIIDFPNKFEPGLDPVDQIPNEEYSNFLKFLVFRLYKIVNTGKFKNEQDIEAKKQIYEAKSNPVKLFLQEFCEFDENSYVYRHEFEKLFNAWYSENYRGYKLPSWQYEVVPALRKEGLEIKKRVARDEQGNIIYTDDGKQKIWRTIEGIRWKEKIEDQENNLSEKEGYVEKIDTLDVSEIEIDTLQGSDSKTDTFDTKFYTPHLLNQFTSLSKVGVKDVKNKKEDQIGVKNENRDSKGVKNLYITNPEEVFKKWFSTYENPLSAISLLTLWVVKEFYDAEFTKEDVVKKVLKDNNQEELAQAWITIMLREGELMEIKPNIYKFTNPDYLIESLPSKLLNID